MIFMFLIIIGVIIGFVWSYLSSEEVIPSIVVSILTGFIGLVVGGLIYVLSLSAMPPAEECKLVEGEKIGMVALKDNFQVEGSAYLLSSYTDQELQYNYVVDTPTLGRVVKEVDADLSYIKYVDENTHPYIQEIEVRSPNGFVDWLIGPSYSIYTFYIPEGSMIENEYEIDLE